MIAISSRLGARVIAQRNVALSIALVAAVGLGAGFFYIFNQEPDERARSSISDLSEEVLHSEEVTQASEPQKDSSQEVLERAVQTDEEAIENGTLPSFDLVRVEPDGAAVIAGRAAPYAELILFHNGRLIGQVTADWAGEWVFVSDEPLETDRHQFALLINKPDALITIPAAGLTPRK